MSVAPTAQWGSSGEGKWASGAPSNYSGSIAGSAASTAKKKGVNRKVLKKMAKGKRCEPVKALTARMYRDCWGWLLFVALAGALAAIAALTFTSDVPPDFICEQYPCMTEGVEAFEHSLLRTLPPAYPNPPAPPPMSPPLVVAEIPWFTGLCHMCIERCGTGCFITGCSGGTQYCYTEDGQCVRNTQNICRLQENDCELKPIDDCVANCRRDTSALFGTLCAAPPPPPRFPPPLPPPPITPPLPPAPPLPPPSAIRVSVQAEQCLYLNSHTCAREGKMPCLPTTCYHELEAADPCRPPTFKLDDVDCNDFDDLDQCLLFSGRVEWPWMQTACTMFEKTPYKQLMEGKIILIYAEVCGVAMLLSLLSFVPLFFAHGKYLLPTVHFACSMALLIAVGTSAYFGGLIWAVLWVISFFSHALYLFASFSTFYNADLIIEMAVGIIKAYPSIIVLGVVEVSFKLALFVGWIFAFATLSGRMGVAVDMLLFVGLVWVCQVVHYTSYTATSGVTATWYFGKKIPHAGLRALKRATTTSFGSVCVGATTMTMLKALKVVTGYLRSTPVIALSAVGAGCFMVVDALLQYANVYGFSHVAIYGTSFGNASKAALTLITAAGFQPMMVDDMVGLSSLVAMVLSGVICAGASFLLVTLDVHGGLDKDGFNGSTVTMIYLPCFIIGSLTGLLGVDVLESILTTFYTCFADEPIQLQLRDPELYSEFIEIWWDSNHPWNPEEEEGEESEEEVETESDEDDGGSATTGAGQSSEFKSSEFKSQEFKL